LAGTNKIDKRSLSHMLAQQIPSGGEP
jgi:hypothetical protein